jgi:hypothetical protein
MIFFYHGTLNASPGSGDPAHWCRYGTFVNDWPNYNMAIVTAQKSFFRKDDTTLLKPSSQDVACPENEVCKTKSYVIKGDLVIVAYKYGDFICSWYPRKEGPEWLSLSDVKFLSSDNDSTVFDWVGKWSQGKDINFTLSRTNKPDELKVSAYACCVGYSMNFGEIEATSKINGNKVVFHDEVMDCTFSLMLLDQVILAKDNNQCGGANVSFSGLYNRQSSPTHDPSRKR